MYLNFNGNLFSLKSPQIMGIVNNTGDSFYAGSRFQTEKDILKRVEDIIENGGAIIDIGAVSTRPGAQNINATVEIDKIRNIILLINKYFPNNILSVDTWRAEVARVAIEEGVAMINDISGGTFDENMLPTIAHYKVPFAIMHTSHKPEVMQQYTHYENIIGDIMQYFGKQVEKCKNLGINDVILDPGFGFGKTLEDNYFLLNNLTAFQSLNLPIMVGISRKSMIYKLFDITPEEALNGTTALHIVALLHGASLLRVHDVKEAKQVIKLYNQLKK